MMKPFAALAALLIAVGSSALPAFARDSYVMDNASLLSPATVSQLNTKIGDFYAQTHKEVVVDIEPAVTGDPKAAAESFMAQQQVNGVLIFIAKSPKTIGVVPDSAASRYFPSGSTAAIRTAIASGFNSGDFNGGVTNGVDLTLNMYRSHLGSLRTTNSNYAPAGTATRGDAGGGFHMGWIWWLIILAVIFFVIRGIFRAISGPRMMPPGYGGGGPMGGPMGGGYGPGYGGGYGGGGGSFFSGLLGGLGGAFLGNELFGGGRNEMNNGGQFGAMGGDQGANNAGDASGFQSDPGQADMGNSSFGSWGGGDSGGGGGWGGGDSGGGGGWGGGDSGGGGGDSGGGGW